MIHFTSYFTTAFLLYVTLLNLIVVSAQSSSDALAEEQFAPSPATFSCAITYNELQALFELGFPTDSFLVDPLKECEILQEEEESIRDVASLIQASNNADLPSETTRTTTVCHSNYGVSSCQTYQITILAYNCGNSICLKTTRIRTRVGLFRWQEWAVPGYLSYPAEILPTTNGWACVEQSDGAGETRTCIDEARERICVTQGFITSCMRAVSEDEYEEIAIPDDLPSLDPTYGNPPQEPTIDCNRISNLQRNQTLSSSELPNLCEEVIDSKN